MSIRRIFPTRIHIRIRHLIRLKIRMETGRSRQSLRQIRQGWTMMPTTVRRCILLMIIGHGLTYVPYIIQIFTHDWSRENVDWFLDPSFHMKMARYWYLETTAQNLLWIIISYVLCSIASKFSDALLVVFIIFGGYHIVDAILFWINFNTQFWLYVDIFWTLIVFIKVAIFPYRQERFARVKSLF